MKTKRVSFTTEVLSVVKFFPLKILSLFIRLYQLTLSPFFGDCCRFHPTCSDYALEALKKHGIFKGNLFIIKRLCKCHPWNDGGYDPVPENQEI